MTKTDLQTTQGRLTPCCTEMKWALSLSYIRKGYLWYVGGKRRWIPWRLNIKGEGYADMSPIGFCPFSGHNLDIPED